jgi:hypothetical protein
MAFDQFPPKECIEIDRNIFIHKSPYDSSFWLWLKVGVQFFCIGEPDDEEEHALWRAKMLQKALDRLVLERESP